MALRGTKTHAASSKASFIRDEQKDGFTSALFPPLGPGLLVPLLLTAPLGPFSAGQRGCELRPLCSHVSVLVYSVRLCPLSQKTCKEIDQQLLTLPPLPPPQFRYEKHTCTFMCAGFTVNAGGAVCSSLTLGGGKVWNYAWIVVEMGTICLEYVVWPGSNPPDHQDSWKTFFFSSFFSTSLRVTMFWYHEQIICSLVQHMGAPLNQRDLTTRWANLHCVNTKWVIWKRCWHVGLCRKKKKKNCNAFTYSVNAPVPCNVHPHIHSLSFPNKEKKKKN